MARGESSSGRNQDRDLNAALGRLTRHAFELALDLSPQSRQLARRWIQSPATGTWNEVSVTFTPTGFEITVVEEVPNHSRHTRYQYQGNWSDAASPTRVSIAEQAINLAQQLAADA